MKLVEFPEVNRTYAKDQPQYRPLPCHAFADDPQGRIVFCWQLRFWQRLRVLFTGKIWHHVLTFHEPLQPQLLGVEKPQMDHAPSTSVNKR